MSDAIHFDYSPLDEVVCGVHFAGVKWSDIHFGLFYAELGGRYPHTQRRPPLSLFESGGSEGLQIELITEPQPPSSGMSLLTPLFSSKCRKMPSS